MPASPPKTTQNDLSQPLVVGTPSHFNEHLPLQSKTYGSFWLNDSEFALPVDTIREIVDESDDITSIPLSPSFLKGLFNIRGMTIPIVNLYKLFDIAPANDTKRLSEKRKIAIVERGDKCIGILFDRAGEVLNEPISAGVCIQKSNSCLKGGMINDAIVLDQGRRIVLAIDPHVLFGLDHVPHAKIAKSQKEKRGCLDRRRSCLSFELGHSKCAIDLRYIHEVREMPPIDSSWLNGGAAIGTMKSRGKTIPVVDFQSYMGRESMPQLDQDFLVRRKLILFKTNGGLIGLMVSSIDSIIPFFENDISPFAQLSLRRSDVLKGSIFVGTDDVVMLLNHEYLVADPFLSDLAKACNDLQDISTSEMKASEKHAGDRKTYILFSLNGCFAMDTFDVIEVIEKPTTLLQPTFGLNFVEGIINLRGELITLFNLRSIYGLATSGTEQKKVLIFKVENFKYAILVDSVDEIITTTSDKVVPNYETEGSAISSPAFKEVPNILKFSLANDQNKTAMILDAAALVKRCEQMIT